MIDTTSFFLLHPSCLFALLLLPLILFNLPLEPHPLLDNQQAQLLLFLPLLSGTHYPIALSPASIFVYILSLLKVLLLNSKLILFSSKE
ncbi:hypothetical protein J3R30DRAFT_3448272 [Lentinula aciculospora]|uniref:Uncharacterized protein n=1 Tax=Lentinula aciculospora TaxID=153920 RepID=A0A9W9AK96_9AGAR|nr:hypothetical protein J3R30DRAFT_3448272 [Lentinula aciculospora]